MQCVILAGGLATRLRPLTDTIPKALVPVNGVPFADLQLRWLKKQGVDRVVYSIAYRGHMIREFVGDGSDYGLSVSYVDEGADLKGTGGALRLVASCDVAEESFLVIYGDSYLEIEVAAVWSAFLASGRPAQMTVIKTDGREPANCVVERDLVVGYDKRTPKESFIYVDYGLLAFQRSVVLAEIAADATVDLAVLQAKLALSGRLGAYVASKPYFEVGSPAGLRAFEAHLDAERE